MKKRGQLVLLAVLTSLLVYLWWPSSDSKLRDPVQQMSIEEFTPRVAIPRFFPAITDPNIVDSNEATRLLSAEELVLGVSVGDTARAYPVNMLNGPQREIINDELGGLAIAATW